VIGVIRKSNTYHGGTENGGARSETFYHRDHRGTQRKIGKQLTAKDAKDRKR
jgi:hypothetical protein